MKSLIKSGKLDKLGMTASIACAVHCAALPFLITALPLLGVEFLANIWIEIVMVLLSLAIAFLSMVATFPHHRNIIPIIVLILGFLLIGTGHFLWDNLEGVLIPLGGFAIAAAHFINWRLNRSCTH